MNHRVLVVDDEPHVRRLLRRLMEQRGYDVAEAVDGRDAIHQLCNSDFDLVIADIVMPETDGLEVIMFLKKTQPHVKVIAVSAAGNELYLASAKGLGASRVFLKPFDLADITRAAEELLLSSQSACSASAGTIESVGCA